MRAFTLVELIIVIAIIAIIAAVGIPNLLRSRATANEGSTVGSLRTIATFEAVFRQQSEVDQNGNGQGEFALLGELASELALRPLSPRLVQPIYITQQFSTGGSAGNGSASKAGFYYTVYLSNATPGDEEATGTDKDLGGTPVQGGPAADLAAISKQEQHYALYAWPMEYGRSGYRCFFVNEAAEVYFTKMAALTYDGLMAAPAANSAYLSGSRVFKGRIASGSTPGNDNNLWLPTGG